MQRSIDNAVSVAKWLAACARSDAYQPGCDGAACRVRDHLGEAFDGAVKHVGKGYFSAVFTMPEYFGSDVVVKACVDPGELGFVYLADCMQNPGPHLPTVYHVERMFGVGGKALGYVAVLKKLRPCTEAEKVKYYSEMGRDVRHTVTEPAVNSSSFHHQCFNVFSKYSPFAGWDLHADNVMYDEHGNLIITDPITSLTCESDKGKPRELLTGMMRSLGLPEAA